MQSSTKYLKRIVGVAVIFCMLLPSAVHCCPGCVQLDEHNFKRVIERFPYTIVKFDQNYPYGEKHEQYGQFSKIVNKGNKDLLVATVGVKDYGEKENEQLAEHYGFDSKNFPGILLFRDGSVNDFIRYPKNLEVTQRNLQKFVLKNTKMFIANEGCLKEFTPLSSQFLNVDDEERARLLKEAENIETSMWNPEDKASAEIYILYMRLIMEKGNQYVQNEIRRLKRVLADKVSREKKNKLRIKLNILNTFSVRDEL